MKEFESPFEEGLRVGLRNRENNPLNSQALTECFNAKIMEREKGLLPYTPLSLPPNWTVTYPEELHTPTDNWPLPQLYIGDRYGFLFNSMEDGSEIFQVFDDWTIDFVSHPAVTVGDMWDVAEFGDYFIATNGNETVYWDADACRFYTFPTYTFLTVCNFKQQLVAAYSHVGSLCDEAPPSPYTHYRIVWSKIGNVDLTMDITNEAGLMYPDYNGPVRRIMRLGNMVIVYGRDGIMGMRKYASPAPTFGRVELADFGIPYKGCVAGNEYEHVFLDTTNHLWRATPEFKLQFLGYKEFMDNLTTANIIITYLDTYKEYFISDGVVTYLLTPWGMSQVYQHPTSIYNVGGSLYGLSLEDDDSEFRLTTDTLDFKQRALKHIEALEFGIYTAGTVTAAVDWRNTRGAFRRSDWMRVNDLGNARIGVTGGEFRLCVKSTVYSDVQLDYIKPRVKLVDKRFIRGLYGA